MAPLGHFQLFQLKLPTELPNLSALANPLQGHSLFPYYRTALRNGPRFIVQVPKAIAAQLLFALRNPKVPSSQKC